MSSNNFYTYVSTWSAAFNYVKYNVHVNMTMRYLDGKLLEL